MHAAQDANRYDNAAIYREFRQLADLFVDRDATPAMAVTGARTRPRSRARTVVLFLIPVLAVLFLGHHLACPLTTHLCTSPAELLRMLVVETGPEDFSVIPGQHSVCGDLRQRDTSCRRFLLLAEPRGGSTYTQRVLLDGHPEIRCQGEVLYRLKSQSPGWPSVRAALDAALFDEGACRPAKHVVKWVGAKVNMGQVPPDLWPQFVDYVRCGNISVVHLIRTASLASFYNMQIAHLVPPGWRGGPPRPMRADPAHAVAFVDRVQAYRELVRRSFQFQAGAAARRYTLVRYEDLIGDQLGKALRCLQDFFGVDVWTPHPEALRSLGPIAFRRSPCFRKFRNWAELEKAGGSREAFRACASGRPM